MPIRVRAADGQVVTFPDGTSVDDIPGLLRQRGDQQAAEAQARAQADSTDLGKFLTTAGEGAVETAKGFGRALVSPLTALLNPRDTLQGIKSLGTAASEAWQHPEELGPAFLQGAADPAVMGNAAGSLLALPASMKAPQALDALQATPVAKATQFVSEHMPKTVLGTDLSPVAKGLKWAAEKFAQPDDPTLRTPPARPVVKAGGSLSGRPAKLVVEPVAAGGGKPWAYTPEDIPEAPGIISDDLRQTVNPTFSEDAATAPRWVQGQPLEGHLNDALQGLKSELRSDPSGAQFESDWIGEQLAETARKNGWVPFAQDLPEILTEGGLDTQGPNASGQTSASLEALKRNAGMSARGESFTVRRKGGFAPAHEDYQVQPGEQFGIAGPEGFQVLDAADTVPTSQANPVVSRSLNEIRRELARAQASGDQAAIDQLRRAERQAQVIRRKTSSGS